MITERKSDNRDDHFKYCSDMRDVMRCCADASVESVGVTGYHVSKGECVGVTSSKTWQTCILASGR